jgi:ankyrin repeat protein
MYKFIWSFFTQKFFLQFFVITLLLISSSYATNDRMKSSLSQARSSQILENLIILDKSGVDLSVYGQPVWFQAAKLGFTDVISFLMHKYIKIDAVEEKGKTALHFASEMGQVQVVDLLLREGACIDKKIKYESTTPLKLAAFNGHNETVKTLLQYNVNKDENITAMHLATMGGHITIIKTLLDAGFDINGTEGWPDNPTALRG